MAPASPSQAHFLIARQYMEEKQLPLEGKEVINCIFKDTKSWWWTLSTMLCWPFHSPWRTRHARARFCFPAGLRKMVAPTSASSQEKVTEAWLINMFFLKSLGCFIRSVRWWRRKVTPLSCLPSAFSWVGLRSSLRNWGVLVFLTGYPVEIYTMEQNAFSRQITQICSMSLFHNLSAHREVPMGTAFSSVISFYFKSDLQFPDRKSEQKSCKIYYCDNITFLCGLLSI